MLTWSWEVIYNIIMLFPILQKYEWQRIWNHRTSLLPRFSLKRVTGFPSEKSGEPRVYVIYSKIYRGNFPGGPGATTLCSQCRGPGLIPGQGTRSHIWQLRVQTPQIKDPAYYNWGQRSHVPRQRPKAAKENRYLKANKWKQNKKTPKQKRLGTGKIYSKNLVSAVRTFPCKS